MHNPHVVIVGGGISGLSTAFFLSRRASREHLPLKITVLEASERFGGVLKTLYHEELRMEAGADAFYAGQKETLDLCRDLGLQDDVAEAAPCFRNFFYLDDQTPVSVPGLPASFYDALRFLSDPRLSFSAKCRMLMEPFVPARKEEGDESLASFARRRLGQGFYQEVVKPLAQSVYMMDPETLSMGAIFSRLWRAEKEHGSITGAFLKAAFFKEEKNSAEFFTLKQGLEGLVRALVRELGECELRRSSPVRQCVFNSGWEIALEDGSFLRPDGLCLAMNACDASKLMSATAPELSGELSSIRYDSIASMNLIYRSSDIPDRGMAPGFLISQEGDQYPFSSLKWLGKSMDGKYFTSRAFLSEGMMPELFQESDAKITQKVRAFLSEHFGIRAEPLFAGVERYPQALPRYETGHLERVSKIEKIGAQYPGLFLTGNGFRGFGITDCIRQAKIAASSLKL